MNYAQTTYRRAVAEMPRVTEERNRTPWWRVLRRRKLQRTYHALLQVALRS